MTARLSLKHFLIARMQPDIHLQQLDWIALKIEIPLHRDDGVNIDHAAPPDPADSGARCAGLKPGSECTFGQIKQAYY